MFGILSVMVLVTLIVVIAVFIYYLIYIQNINKKIQSGQVSNKKMVDIPKIIMIAIIVLLLLYSVILSVAIRQRDANATIVNRNNFAVIDLTDYKFCGFAGPKENNDASFAKLYSKENNEGYDKSIVEDGDFVFTVFTRNSDPDDFHPDFFCYVDYVGEVRDELDRYSSNEFVDESSDAKSSVSSGGEDIDKSLLYIGNLNDGISLIITEGVLDDAGVQSFYKAEEEAYKADKDEFPSFVDYAISSGSVIITIE